MNTLEANPLSNKINKILNTQLDNETLEALKNVSDLVSDNNLTNRRNLRTNIEKQSLKINEQFVESFRSVENNLNDLYGNVNQLNDDCQQMIRQIETTRSQTSNLLKQTNQLTEELKQLDVKELVAKRFIDCFQLKPEELTLINNTNDDIDERFFQVLHKVRDIHDKSKLLLASNQHITGIEIMDSMALHEEAANERLYRWTLNVLRTISSDIIEVHPQLFRAMACLQEREILFKYCLDEYVTVRRSAIVRNFIEALTRGRPNANTSAIELHSNDVIRYVGDMLAFLHQSVANEKEMIDTLLKMCDKDKLQSSGVANLCISSITEALCRPFKVRVEQSLISDSTSANKSVGPAVYYRIKNIISFYLHTLTQTRLLIPESQFIFTLKELLTLSDKIFYNSLNYCIARIGRSSASDLEVPDTDLKPTESVTHIVAVLKEVLSSQNSGLSEDKEREVEVKRILSTVIEPLIQSCIISASKLTAIEMAVFLFNCLYTIDRLLSEYQFTESFRDLIRLHIDKHIETIVNEQISHIISYLGLSSLQNAIQMKDDLGIPLSQLSGCDPLAIRSAMLKMDSFMARPTELVLKHSSHLIDSNTKDSIWKRSLQSICVIYEHMYRAVNDKDNQYVEPQSLINYKPEQIRMLLL